MKKDWEEKRIFFFFLQKGHYFRYYWKANALQRVKKSLFSAKLKKNSLQTFSQINPIKYYRIDQWMSGNTANICTYAAMLRRFVSINK